jgi:hypothetical protein
MVPAGHRRYKPIQPHRFPAGFLTDLPLRVLPSPQIPCYFGLPAIRLEESRCALRKGPIHSHGNEKSKLT